MPIPRRRRRSACGPRPRRGRRSPPPASPCASARRPPCARLRAGNRRMPPRDAPADRAPRRLRRRHGRRQVDQPLGLAANRLITSRAAMAFSSRMVTCVQARRDDPLADDIVYVEDVIVVLLRRQRWRCGSGKRAWLCVDPAGRNGDEFLLGITQRRESTAEHAAGIDIDRAVQPISFGAGPARTRVAEPHDQHRYRLRVRRQADGPAISREGAGRRCPPPRPTASRRVRSCPASAGTAIARQRSRQRRPAGHRGRAAASGSSRRGCSGSVTIREENAAAALEVMSRFAANPKWLIYLPPTMSPSRDLASSTDCWSIRPRRSPTTARKGVAQGGVRAEAHGVAGGGRSSAATRTWPAQRFGVLDEGSRHLSTPARGAAFFDDTRARGRVPGPRCAAALDASRVLGGASRPTGSASTAS